MREMSHVLATENEGLRKEVKRWVQKATTSERQLEEAQRHLQRQSELEKDMNSLNIEAIQIRKKNKRLLRDIATMHSEAEAQKVCIRELKQELERVSKVVIDFQSALDEQATSSQRITTKMEALDNLAKEYKI